jgi:2-polyprenyl-3-methyl-5-hydroxy-6-metoxy-1,4-benzoquinol methylase
MTIVMRQPREQKWFQMANLEYVVCQNRIITLLKGHKAHRYLDIGCNAGEFTRQCANILEAQEIHGIELDPEIAVKAEKNGVRVLVADAGEKYPYPDHYFDVITANQLLEHVADTDNVLRECHRLLTEDGLLILGTPNLCSLLQRVLILSGNQPTTLHVSEVQVGNFIRGTTTGNEHIHAFSPGALEDLIKYHGFRIEKKLGCGFYPLMPPASAWAARLFPRLAVFYIISARKDRSDKLMVVPQDTVNGAH